MTFISPSDYDRAEAAAVRFMPNRVIEAYSPEAFRSKGYPTHVGEDAELFRYVDAMYENPTHIADVVGTWLDGLTEEEFTLLTRVCEAASDISFSASGRRAIPARSALAALIVLRYVRFVFPSSDHAVLELGPGSGSLGAMLSMLGYSYLSMDVTQAFYIYQSRLYEHVCGDDRFIELAAGERQLTEFRRPPDGVNIHVPWWKFVADNPMDLELDLDCVVVSGAIAEMHINAVRYLARQARRWLSRSPGDKAFIIAGPGDDSINAMPTVLAELKKGGLDPVYADGGGFDGRLTDRELMLILQPAKS